jgi:Rrf2 family transcriptional regulator, nitric oxide-sensitive transcriptional repressor
MISQTAEYALRAIVFLADHPAEAQTAEAIAKDTKVPVGYLAKIMQGLARSGLVTSQRGLYGGFTINRPIKELTIYDVIQAVDPIRRITECPLGLEGHGTALCPLHRGLDNAMAAVEMAFKKLTIYQVLNQPQTNRPLCNFPRAVTPQPE